MTENAGNSLSDRDLRDQAAGKVLDWLDAPATGSAWDAVYQDPEVCAAIRLLAEHAQRESALDRVVETIEVDRAARDNRRPLVTLDRVFALAEAIEAFPMQDRARTVREAAGALKLLSAELIAQDRRLAEREKVIASKLYASLPQLMGVAAEAAALFREYQAHHEARSREPGQLAAQMQSVDKAERNRVIADRIETILFGCPRASTSDGKDLAECIAKAENVIPDLPPAFLGDSSTGGEA